MAVVAALEQKQRTSQHRPNWWWWYRLMVEGAVLALESFVVVAEGQDPLFISMNVSLASSQRIRRVFGKGNYYPDLRAEIFLLWSPFVLTPS